MYYAAINETAPTTTLPNPLSTGGAPSLAALERPPTDFPNVVTMAYNHRSRGDLGADQYEPFNYPVYVEIGVMDVDESTINRIAWRYAKALHRAVIQNDTLSDFLADVGTDSKRGHRPCRADTSGLKRLSAAGHGVRGRRCVRAASPTGHDLSRDRTLLGVNKTMSSVEPTSEHTAAKADPATTAGDRPTGDSTATRTTGTNSRSASTRPKASRNRGRGQRLRTSRRVGHRVRFGGPTDPQDGTKAGDGVRVSHRRRDDQAAEGAGCRFGGCWLQLLKPRKG